MRAFLLLPGTTTLLISVGALVALVLIGGLVLDARYRDPSSGEGLGPFAALYLSLSLVVLSPVSPLPADLASRVVFVVVPLGFSCSVSSSFVWWWRS